MPWAYFGTVFDAYKPAVRRDHGLYSSIARHKRHIEAIVMEIQARNRSNVPVVVLILRPIALTKGFQRRLLRRCEGRVYDDISGEGVRYNLCDRPRPCVEFVIDSLARACRNRRIAQRGIS